MEKLNYISTYSGAVGTWNIHKLGLQGLLAVDMEETVTKAFELNYNEERFVPFLQGNMLELNGSELLRYAGSSIGEPFLYITTPPCQGVSAANPKQDFLNKRNVHLLHCWKMIDEVKPKFFLLENVPGLLSKSIVPLFNEIVNRIHELSDYHVEARVMNSLYYNSPQERNRTIFVGVRRDLEIAPPWPEPSMSSIETRTIGNLFPYADGIASGQSEKSIRLRHHHLPTLTTGHDQIFMLEQGRIRHFTAIEYMTAVGLHGFSTDGLHIRDVARLVGNAVPAPFMETLVKAIRDAYLQKYPGSSEAA